MYRNGRKFGYPQGRGQKNSNFKRSPNRGRGPSKLGRDVSIFIKKANPQTVGAYAPHNNFDDFNITRPLKLNILNRGYKEPTPIQDQAIEPILEGRDLIGLANTGTGKTAAFLIPILDKIFRKRADKALILAPTRELASQINEELRAFATDLKIYSTLIIGGANMNRQIHDLRRNPHVVIATPGRLKDLIQQRLIRLDDFSIFVLDEVDLMVDIGFIDDVNHYFSQQQLHQK